MGMPAVFSPQLSNSVAWVQKIPVLISYIYTKLRATFTLISLSLLATTLQDRPLSSSLTHEVPEAQSS